VTGSINQLGEVQGVGGVNEKIEGFYAACALRGLTGTQGVVLPRSNVRDLCLSRAVCEACASGAFHVWAVDTVDEALRLLTGLEVGLAGDATDTLLGRVEQGLTELALAGRRAALP
jgi:Lon-like ATP-dependent protease